MGYALKVELEMEETTCCVCATRFAVDKLIMANRRQQAGDIWCPNGHKIGWTKSEASRLRDELAEERRKLAAEQQRVALERQMRFDAEAKTRKAEQSLKRQTKRINAGVCPHCNRTFQQLARHMQCKHAEMPENSPS